MGLNDTPSGERIHIGFFGCRNAGKSSLVNAVTGQEISVVSNVKGTTTDPVKKAMELLPLGPVMIIDTPGYDDEGGLGDKRVYAAKKILRICDIAVLVTVAGTSLNSIENELIALFKQRNIPYIIVKNKADLLSADYNDSKNTVYTSTVKKIGIEKLKNTIGKAVSFKKENNLAGDLIKNGDIAVLVIPIDSAAPKGRLILPQQQVIRDIIENGGIAVVSVETELKNALSKLLVSPSIVITDSQVFEKVSKIVPENIPLTSFSILMARYKGFLKTAVSGARKINELKNGSNVLISEGCTHHRQCDDIGTVKLPKWLMEYTKAKLNLEWSSGSSFPQDLSKYDLIIHCGGCMLNANEIEYRMKLAAEFEVPFTNYGTAIAFMKGILERSVAVIPEIE
ncbi:MAG: [FeFe] hydrogenase H-cluster maturation GTPase HydF [Clostridiales bacterium]|nr:[FeFe] hydrogenase H-cluster maturation GTPase HydF [Clostridiales bacterium]